MSSSPTAAPAAHGWSTYFVIGITMLALGAMAVPQPDPPAAVQQLSPERIELEQALARGLETWRAALQQYRERHATFPGFQPGREGARMHGSLDASRILPQLLMATDAWGNSGPLGHPGFPHRPCLSGRAPLNPVNGLATLRVLGPDEAFAPEADGSTGWVYKPSSGEIRINAPGAAAITGQPFWEL